MRKILFSLPGIITNAGGVRGRQYHAIINGEHVYAPFEAGSYNALHERIRVERRARQTALRKAKAASRSAKLQGALQDGHTYLDAHGREAWIVGDTRGHNDGSVWSVQGNHFDRETGRRYTYAKDTGRVLLPADSAFTLVTHRGETK